MLKATVTDVALFENLLGVINKFVQQCQFVLTTTKVGVYCINPTNFASARLLLDSNAILLNKGQSVDSVNICIKNVIALKSAISIVREIEGATSIELQLEDIKNGSELEIKSIKYKSKKGCGFNIVTIKYDVIKDFICNDLKENTKLAEDWSFYVNPKNLSIIQNKTNNIVNMDEVSVFIYPTKEDKQKEHNVIFELTSKKTAAINSIALPVADSYNGSLEKCQFDELAIHESSFRIFNILQVTGEKDLFCSFTIQHNLFFVQSKLTTKDDGYISSRLLIQIVKGK